MPRRSDVATQRIHEALGEVTDWQRFDADAVYDRLFPAEVTRSHFREVAFAVRETRLQAAEDPASSSVTGPSAGEVTLEICERPANSEPGEQISGAVSYPDDAKRLDAIQQRAQRLHRSRP
jgi:hypothetical protein